MIRLLLLPLLAIVLLVGIVFVGIAFAVRAMGTYTAAPLADEFASATVAKKEHNKKLLRFAGKAMLVFALSCILMVVIIFFHGLEMILGGVGCVLGALIVVLGAIGIRRALKVDRSFFKALFILVFFLITAGGALSLTAYSVTIALFSI